MIDYVADHVPGRHRRIGQGESWLVLLLRLSSRLLLLVTDHVAQGVVQEQGGPHHGVPNVVLPLLSKPVKERFRAVAMAMTPVSRRSPPAATVRVAPMLSLLAFHLQRTLLLSALEGLGRPLGKRSPFLVAPPRRRHRFPVYHPAPRLRWIQR